MGIHLVRKGVLEGELPLREEVRLVKEFRSLKRRKAPLQFLLAHLGNGGKGGERKATSVSSLIHWTDFRLMAVILVVCAVLYAVTANGNRTK